MGHGSSPRARSRLPRNETQTLVRTGMLDATEHRPIYDTPQIVIGSRRQEAGAYSSRSSRRGNQLVVL
eukprot:6198252-Pleurochrysis_carterae.AAC.4